MSPIPHPDSAKRQVNCAVITVSDTRTVDSDRSGLLIQQLLTQHGHAVSAYAIVPDEPAHIQSQLETLGDRPDVETIIFNGGTGIAPRDTTYDAIEQRLEKILPGFGELFRSLSYQDIGSRAIASRAVAGVFRNRLIFSLPGSSNAVRLAMEQLILPELSHLMTQLRG